ncbi:unnamed protein product, partial [Rotaria sp. Silwood1]
TTTDEIIYCKRVQRLTPQHIEQKQLPVTLYIFVDGSKEPRRLTNISLQWNEVLISGNILVESY